MEERVKLKNPGPFPGDKMRGTSPVAKAGLAKFEAGEVEVAIALLEQALADEPTTEVALFLGALYLDRGQYSESGRVCARALELAPRDADVLYQYGLYCFLTNDHARAEEFFLAAYDVNPDSAELANDLGVLAFFRKDFEAAGKFFQHAIKVTPDAISPKVNLGYVCIAQKDLGSAQSLLEELKDSDSPEVVEFAEALERASKTQAPDTQELKKRLRLTGLVSRISPMSMIDEFRQDNENEALGVSIVIPVMDERENVPILHKELTEVLGELGETYEIIFVDDGSTDGTSEALGLIADSDPRVVVIEFRRNYGQTAALSAGFKYCRGEIVVTLDGDLQNDPRDIPKLLEKLAEGYDLVNGWRKNRQDKTFTRKVPSWVANRLINKLIEGTGVQLKDFGCTLKAYKKGIVKNIHLYGEMHRFIPVFAAWLGVRVAEIQVNHRARRFGTAKYDLSRVSRVIFDLIVVRFFSDYMTRPIQFFGKIAKKMTSFGLGSIALLWGLKAWADFPVSYDALLILLALLLMSGLQIIILGLTGELLIRSYFEGQEKDHYVVRKVLGG